ncbi:MAG: hypothetical protein BGO07_02320 [Alphaproteobacteria bacterium 40-19]|nr:MAG: hypothetical protein BGO07_02320 [Alphaproteobacteria bacterium 40-19]
MKILKIFISWSAFYCLPSFADLSQWVKFIKKEGDKYNVTYKDTTELNNTEKNERKKSFSQDGVEYFEDILGLNWEDLRPHYNSHFADAHGALLEPIKNNTYPDFPLTTGKKALHTAFEVPVGRNVDDFIKDWILSKISSVAAPE